MSIWQLGDAGDQSFRLVLPGEIAVDVLAHKKIVVRPCEGLPQITINHFLADQVFPRLLSHTGALVIHAGAVGIGEGAIMLVGQSGRGKSTLVASFDQAGAELLGDDAMVVSPDAGESRVQAVYPSLRLMPDSIEAVMPGVVTAGPVAHYSTKERIEVGGERAAGGERAIRAMFAIGTAAESIAIRAMPVAQACMALVENSFALDPSDLVRARSRMEQASEMARNTPAFELSYPRDYARLPEVRQAILDQVAALERA